MKILILEDSALARRFIKDELLPAGYETLEARTPDEALNILGTVPDIDLISLRVVMEGMDGFQFLEHLQSEAVQNSLRRMGNDKVPAIIVTSTDTDGDRLRGFQVGAADFIRKPWPPGELLHHVNKVLGVSTELAGLSVLVVDDSRTARSFIRNSLVRLGVQIHEVEDGDLAMEFLKNPDNQVDLVITDLHMERVDGDALTVGIRGELGMKELPVIFLSGNEDKDKTLSLFKMGATDYLQKPFLQEELVARMRAYLTRVKDRASLVESVARLRDMNLVKDQFLAACSHDLRSPLTGILGYAQLLQDEPELRSEDREMVAGIQKSGEYLLTLINDLLDIGKMASGHSEIQLVEVDLLDVIQDSARSLIHTAGPKGVRLEVVSSVQGARVMGDRSSLMRVCNNLLSNAIKFTPDGGMVEVSLGEGRGRELVLAVTDTGIGIAEKDIPELFNRYSRVSQSGTSGEKGTGLGLAITRELLEAHGGSVAVASTPGQGSTFRITLPAISDFSAENPAPGEESRLNLQGHENLTSGRDQSTGQYVLLVDDQLVNRKVGTALLRKMGVEVETAADGDEALQLYRQSCQGRRYDLILMDLEMPNLDGLEATRLLREYEQGLPAGHEAHRQPVPVLAMTASSAEASLGQCMAVGMNDFLTKPFVVSQITAALDRWVAVPA